jgi:hypothetical protein
MEHSFFLTSNVIRFKEENQLEIDIFDLKMMMKSGLDFLF